jgi:outer membrane protein
MTSAKEVNPALRLAAQAGWVQITLWGLAIAGFGMGLMALFFATSKPSEIAYVKVGPLLEKYQGMIDAKSEYKAKSASWQMNVDTLAKETERQLREYERQRVGMSGRERELSEELLRGKQQQYMQYREAMQRKGQEEDRKMTEQVLQRVNAYLEAYGKRKGYAIILGANASGNVVYGMPALDITEDVTKGLNEEYKPGSATPVAPPNAKK